MIRQIIERFYPYGLALAAVWAFKHYGVTFPKGHDILAASITIGTVFTGFLATVKSIIMTVQTASFEQLRKSSSFFNLLISFLQESIWTSLAYSFWCLVGYFVGECRVPTWFSLVWVFLTVATLFTFHRVSRILILLMRN